MEAFLFLPIGWRKYILVIKYVEVLRKQSSKPFPNFLENSLSTKRTAWAMLPGAQGITQGFFHQAAENLKLLLNIQDQNLKFLKHILMDDKTKAYLMAPL